MSIRDQLVTGPGKTAGQRGRVWASSPVVARLSERDWQARVTDYATWRGWLSYHTHDSRHSEPGFPDLVLLRGDRCVVTELKSDTGKVTGPQQRWLDAFGLIPGLEVHVWRPADWPVVQETLR